MNWYVLYAYGFKAEKIAGQFEKECGIEAFIPKYEFYYRKTKEYHIKPMFNGYIFIRTHLSQEIFSDMLRKLSGENNAMIRQLKKENVPSLTKDEIQLFEILLDSAHIVRMSQAHIEDGKAKIVSGPLTAFEDHIVRVDKHNQYAYLDLAFMDREIKVGLKITGKNE